MTVKTGRAYSLLTEKEFSEEDDAFIISGIASTPTPDRAGDVVNPMGAKFKTPMPLLWQHMHSAPVGTVTFAKPNRNGIPFKAAIPNIKEAGRLKDRVDEARQSIQYGLVTAVSIGFRANYDEIEVLEDGGYKFNEWEWVELSLVTIPANAEALLDSVKTFDAQLLRDKAASGQLVVARAQTPGDSGQLHRKEKRGFFYLDTKGTKRK